MSQIISLIFFLLVSSCNKKEESWQRQNSNFRDRGLLFMFYGNESLEPTADKNDLFWGQSVALPTFFQSRPKPEHLILECVEEDKKLYSQFGNITFIKNTRCLEGALFDDRLVSNKKGGSDLSHALLIPTIENHYEIFDDLSSSTKSRWYRLHYQQKADLLIEAKSSIVLDGRLYFDSNQNDKIDKNELIDVLTVDEIPQRISTEIEPGTYFFQISNDTTELPLNTAGDKTHVQLSNGAREEVLVRKDILTESSDQSDTKKQIPKEKSRRTDISNGEREVESLREKLDSTFKLRFSTRYPPSYADVGGGNNESAFILKTNEGPVSVNDSIGRDDKVDFYKFDLDAPRSLKIKLDNLAGLGDADLELYRDINADGKTSEDELVAVSQGSGVDSLFIPFAAQGSWYVKIAIYQGEITYHLEVSTGETRSSDLAVLSEKVNQGVTFAIVNDGPSDAKDVKVSITLSDGQKILTENPLTQLNGTGNYLLRFGQIAKGEKRSFMITGEPGSVVMVEVESKLPDSDTSNNAMVKKL